MLASRARAAIGAIAAAMAITGLAGFAPAAAAKSGVVTDGAARFQVITPTLIRMEYAADKKFEDRPTMTVQRPKRSVPAYSVEVKSGWRIIRTSAVELWWRRGSAFTSSSLRLKFTDHGKTQVVRPVAGADHRFLGGWTRALDLASGPVPLNPGILTRDGWYVLDDSATALLTSGGRAFATRPERSGAYQDWYAFAYGTNYARALSDLRVLTGSSPLLPRNAFGVWFSKYYPYSDQEFRELADRFAEEGIPLDTLSLDTDYKRVHDPVGALAASLAVGLPGKPFSWNGWDWNRDLFPDPDGFVDWAHGRGINLLANIHPSVNSRDPAFAAANETAGGLAVSSQCKLMQADLLGDCHVFDWTDPRQLKAYFNLHKTFAGSGVDAFWLDWCCEGAGAADAPGLSPDTWINSQYGKYQAARGSRWPAFSRIGASYVSDGVYGDRGIGAGGTGALAEHRSAIQFTGDTCATWEMLAFQAEMTAAASAIGLPYVSHDIGSFNGTPSGGGCQAVAAALSKSPVPDDLYVRWLQFGAFQPIDRLHSNHGKRLPWEYGAVTETAATAALRLRGSLVPYTYTAARRAVDTGLPITGPLYLSWPRTSEAYKHPTQYTYGADLVVAPVTSAGDPAQATVWIPPGDWVEYTTGTWFKGPALKTLSVPLARIPVLVRAGAVIPTHEPGVRAGTSPARRLVLTAYPGKSGRSSLYDDAGHGFGYKKGEYSRTTFTQGRANGAVKLVIGSARGSFAGRPSARRWDVRIVSTGAPTSVTLNGGPVRRATQSGGYGWSYDAKTRVLRVVTGLVATAKGTTLRVR